MAAEGSIEVQRVTPGVVLTRMQGHAKLDHLKPIAEAVSAEIEAGRRPEVFHDWERMTGYDSDVRIAMTEWYREVSSQVERVHVLAASRLVVMGVSVVALAVGARIDTYSSRSRFDSALAAAKRRG